MSITNILRSGFLSLKNFQPNFSKPNLDIKNFFFDPYKIFLIIIFSIIFLPHAFIIIDDINLIIAFETDPGAITHSIEDMFKSPIYNMHNSYHSKFYGWTYISLNFLLLAPIKIFLQLTHSNNGFIFYLTIRLILFTIGLATVLLFYTIVNRFIKNSFFSTLAAILYIFSPNYNFFYFIHPETTGTLFLFLGILCLLEFIQKTQDKYYFYGLICLVFSSLAKQPFFFTSLPVLFLFLHFYCRNNQKKYLEFILSKKFAKIFLTTSLIAIGVLFIIHPYAILRFNKFIEYQTQLSQFFTNNQYPTPFKVAVIAWIATVKSVPIISISVALSPLTIPAAFFLYYKTKKQNYFLYAANLLGAIFVLIMTICFNSHSPIAYYLQSCYPFFLLNIISLLWFLIKNKNIFVSTIAKIFSTYFIYLILASSAHSAITQLNLRLNYKESTAYKTYSYVKNNLTLADKLVYDHYVALPSQLNEIGCHYWHGCGTDHIEEFKPNYVMFDEKFQINNMPYNETERLKKYVKDHKLKLIETIKSNGQTISIYKK